MGSLRFGALTMLLSVLSLPAAASADDGAAALLPFQGPQASKVRQSVQKGLRAADVPMVPLKRVTATVKKTKGYAKQAGKLEASVLVRTRVRRVEGRWVADTEVRNAKGQRVEKLRTNSSSITRLSNRIVSQLIKTGRMPGAVAVAAPKPEREPAPPTQPRIVVRSFTGAQAAKIRGAAVRGLRSEPIELFPNKQFVGKARNLGVNLDADGGHIVPAGALAVSGLIEGDVLHEDGVWSAYVRLVDGGSATVISQHFYDANTSAGLAKSVQAGVGSDFRKDIKKLGVAVPATVAIVPATAVTSAPAEPTSKKAKAEVKYKATRTKEERPAAVDIEVDFRLVHRDFRYEDDLRGDLRDYKLGIGPGVGTKLQYFPGAHFTAGVGAQFGIDFEWERLFNFDSTRADGARFPTDSQQFLVGLRWRYPTGRWEPSIVVDYGVHSFRFGVSGPPVPGEDNTPGIPSVKYEFVRIGAGFRVGIGRKEQFIVAANAAFRGVFSLGGIGTAQWFPEAKANGMDAMLMLGYALPLGFEIRIGADYRRYWFDLNPVAPDPPYVAGGALDQYWGFSIGAAWRR
jgi:ribosomal protein L12E/L44/L45/RPP1/RPP2